MNREEFANKWAAVEIYEDGLPISIVIQARYNDLLADLDSLSLPPAEGAVPDNAAEQNKRMREWFKERTGLDDTLLSIHMEQIDVMLKGVQQQPTAEGAEEILERAFNNDAIRRITYIPDIRGIISAMNDFATLHAQRIAEKMVEERLREELMAYDKFLSNTYWGVSHLVKRDEAVDEYLKTRESND